MRFSVWQKKQEMKDQEQSGRGSGLQISETVQFNPLWGLNLYIVCFFVSTVGERWWLFNCNKKDLRKAIQWVVSGVGRLEKLWYLHHWMLFTGKLGMHLLAVVASALGWEDGHDDLSGRSWPVLLKETGMGLKQGCDRVRHKVRCKIGCRKMSIVDNSTVIYLQNTSLASLIFIVTFPS